MTQLALRLANHRDLLKKDLGGTLARIVDAGFLAVEVTEMLGESNEHFAQALADAGLHVVSLHTQLHHLRSRFAENVATDQLLNSEYLVVPVVQLDEYGSGWERLGEELGRIGALVEEQGPRLAYQPGKADFRPDRGATGFDFLEQTAGETLNYELDLKILSESQIDAESLAERLKRRAALIVLDFGDREANSDDQVIQLWRQVDGKRSTIAVVSELPGAGDRWEKLGQWVDLLAV